MIFELLAPDYVAFVQGVGLLALGIGALLLRAEARAVPWSFLGAGAFAMALHTWLPMVEQAGVAGLSRVNAGVTAVAVLEGGQHVFEPAAAAERLIALLEQPVELDGHELVVGASIGISQFPEDGHDAETLLRHADAAMYAAKRRTVGGWQYFTPELDAGANRRLTLRTRLRQALRQGQLQVHFQPVVELGSGAVVGMEALARWNDPELGDVSPAEFIPVAEASGLIGELGDWVLAESAARVARGLRGSGSFLAVNVSARQLAGGRFVDRVARVLADTGLPAARLELEITERELVGDLDGSLAALEALRDLGVAIVLDDFGTGYSSLAYLKRLPVDKLKIDRSFVAGLPASAADRALCRTITSLARGLGLGLVAEGIETPRQAAALRADGCPLGQGFLYGRPAPVLPPVTSRPACIES